MVEKKKTSTFTMHHDRCKPDTWTASDIIAFANFAKFGDLQYAAHLSKLGVQLVLSELHEPKGGTLEHVGWSAPGDIPDFYESVEELASDHYEEYSPVPVCAVYRGPTEYAVRIPIGDGDGNFEGYEVEVKATEAEAQAFAKSLTEETAA